MPPRRIPDCQKAGIAGERRIAPRSNFAVQTFVSSARAQLSEPLLHGDQAAIPRSRHGDDLTAHFGERLANHFIGRISFQAKVNQFVVEKLCLREVTNRTLFCTTETPIQSPRLTT